MKTAFKSSVDKFFTQEDLNNWVLIHVKASSGDLILIFPVKKTILEKLLSSLRLHLAEKLGLRNPTEFRSCMGIRFPIVRMG